MFKSNIVLSVLTLRFSAFYIDESTKLVQVKIGRLEIL